MALGVLAEIAARADDRAGATRLALESADILRERGFNLAPAHSLIVDCEATGDASNGAEVDPPGRGRRQLSLQRRVVRFSRCAYRAAVVLPRKLARVP